MFGYKNTTGRTLILASVLTLTGGVAMAQRNGQGPGDTDRPAQRQGDREAKRHHGERSERSQRGEQQGQRGPKAMHKRLFAGMDLTDDQKTRIKETMKKFGEERKAWHEAHKDEFMDMREKMRDAHRGDDKDAVQAARDEIKALMESAPRPAAAHDEVRALLNEDQRAIFDERIAKLRERMEQWKEKRGDDPPMGRHGFAPGEAGPPRDADRPQGRRARGAKLFGNLNLTDEQKASLRETMQSDMTREEKKAAVRELLNDEQRTQFDQNIEKMRQYREKHKGDRGEKGKRGERDRRGRDGDRSRGGPGGDRGGSGGARGGSQLDL